MSLDLHPEAAANFSEKAEKLVSEVSNDPYPNHRKPFVDPGIYLPV